MNEWKSRHLSEVGLLKRGKSTHRPRYAFHLYGGNTPFIQTGDVKAAAKFITQYSQTYSEAGLKQSKLWKKGTLCITIAANIAEIGILGFDACFPDSVLGFIADEKNSNQDFVFYLLAYVKRELLAFADGSVQDNINLGTFEKIKFNFPQIEEQITIAEVLSSLDDKIDLLTRQNTTLEALAQAYFRQWFVEENDNELMAVSKIAALDNNSVNPSREPLVLFYHYSIPAYDNAQTPVVELGKAILSNKFIVPPNTILVSKLNPITPRIWRIDKNAIPNSVCSTEFQVLKPLNMRHYIFLYCLMRSSDVTSTFAMSATGTSGSHQRIRPEYILEIEVPEPDAEKLALFNEICTPMMEKVKANQ